MTPQEKEAFSYAAPADLRARITGELRKADLSARESVRLSARVFYVALGLAWAASLVFVAGLSSLESVADPVMQQVVSSHVRSMMAEHLTDVDSSDRHTVKPWFGGKLDFSPQVEDLSAEGFPLVGGRLDYVASRPVAALVYRRQQHMINLFIWPSSGAATRPRLHMQQGYQVFDWSKDGMQYWLISDLNASELQMLAERLRGQ